MPAASSASFSPISSVVSDLILTTSVRLMALDDLDDDPVGLGRVARPVDLPARPLHGLLELDQIAVQVPQRLLLDRPPGLAQFLPVRHLGDHGGALGADGLRGLADVAPKLVSATARLASSGNVCRSAALAIDEVPLRGCQNFRKVNGAHAAPQPVQPAADMHQA